MNILNEPTQGLIVPTNICYLQSHVFNAKYEHFGSLARNQLQKIMFSGTYCKKKKGGGGESHTINYYGKSGDSRTPDPRPPTRALYAKLQREKLHFLSLLTTILKALIC